MPELKADICYAPTLMFKIEDGSERRVEQPLVKRDWSVTDPEARAKAAREVLGVIDEHWRRHAQWYINPKKNAAALVVFRPKVAA